MAGPQTMSHLCQHPHVNQLLRLAERFHGNRCGIVALLAPTQRTEFWFPSSFLRDPVPPWLISFPWLGRRPCHTYANTPTSTSSSGLDRKSTGIAAACRVFQQRLADSITTRMTPTMKIIIRVESR